jgi:hypothetical protein
MARYTTLFDALREIQLCTDTARRELRRVARPDDPAFETLDGILTCVGRRAERGRARL